MNTKQKIIRLFVILLLCFFALSCKKDNTNEPEQPPDTIIPATTKTIDSTSLKTKLISVSSDSSTFVFNEGSATIDNLNVNDIFVSEKGMGLLRKVSQVSKSSGKITVQTTQAIITEAIQKGSASFTRTLSPNQTLKTLYKVSGVQLQKSNMNTSGFFFRISDVVIWDEDGNLSTTSDQIIANGTIDITPTVTFNISIDNWQLKHLELSTTIAEDIDLRVRMNLLALDVKKKKEIYRAYLTPIVTFIGIVPVVITPVMTINLGADAKIYVAVTSSIRQHADFTAGLVYNNGQWNPITNLNHTFNFDPPTVTAGAKLKGYIGPQWNYLLYGVVGPYTQISLFGELDADISRNPWATFYAGIQAGVGVRLEILSRQIIDYYNPEIIGLRAKLWESTNLPTGKITGIVRNAITTGPLSNVSVNVLMSNTSVATSTSQSDGRYEINVPGNSGYKIVFSKQGYLSAEYQNVNVTVGGNTVLEPVLQIDQNYSGNGNIGGTIKNAIDGSSISNVSLKLRNGINVTTGTVISTTSTNSSGSYTFNNFSAGNYTIEASKSSFNTTYFTVICLGGQTVYNQDATMSPVLSSGETRIVLTWGAYPLDIDSHLTGPLSDGSRFHMYFPYSNNRDGSPWPQIVTLDIDDVSGYGPETTTLLQQINSIYRFSVHDYSNRGSTNSNELSNSGALVRIYQSSGLVASFNVPPNTSGTLWSVFEMSGGTITPINQLTYESTPSHISKVGYINPDIELFRNLPKK